MRLIRMSPKARAEISSALRTVPLKVHVSGTRGEFIRFRLKPPPPVGYQSFALKVLAPSHLRGMTPTEARSRLGQTGFRRLTLGVIGRKGPGRSELQSVLVPKVRVSMVTQKYLHRAAVANRCCPNKPRCRHNNPVLAMMAGGAVAGVAGAVTNRLLRNPKGRGRSLSVPEQHQLRIARATLKMSDVGARMMGGPTKEEARNIILRLTGRWPMGNPSPILVGVGKDGNLYKVARKPSTGEWCVVAYVKDSFGGWKRHEGKTYYGDSKQDAIGTFNYIMGPKGPTAQNPLTKRESKKILRDALTAGDAARVMGSPHREFFLGRAAGKANIVKVHGPKKMHARAWSVERAAGRMGTSASRVRAHRNPGVEGFYVWSRTTSVAWYPTRPEAERVAKQMNYRGGTHYTVRAAGPIATLAKRAHRNPGMVRAYRVPGGCEGQVASTLRSLFVWAQAQDGQVLTIGKPSIVAKVIRHVCGQKTGTVSKNPGAAQNVINVPFRAGKKYSVAQIEKWVLTHGTPAMKNRFTMAMAQYKKFHKGAMPRFITYQTYKMGSHPGISDVEFGVSEGHEWMAAYQVPRSSGKWMDKESGGRYVHAHGDSDIDVDVKRPVNLSKLPMRFHTPDGKAVGVIPSKNVKIGEWYEG